MKQCHLAFNMLKDKLCEAPILRYPDSSKPYMLFTDTSKHESAGVLTQEFETEVKGKVLDLDLSPHEDDMPPNSLLQISGFL